MSPVEFGPVRNWRTREQRYSLKAEVCLDCGQVIFPPRDVCPYCTSSFANNGESGKIGGDGETKADQA